MLKAVLDEDRPLSEELAAAVDSGRAVAEHTPEGSHDLTLRAGRARTQGEVEEVIASEQEWAHERIGRRVVIPEFGGVTKS